MLGGTVINIDEHSNFEGIQENTDFYFAHSYFVKPSDSSSVGSTEYGVAFGIRVKEWSNSISPREKFKSRKKSFRKFFNL